MKELSVYPVIYDQKVAWGDMDAFGHVNNVQYYRYIESSRILYMENVNICLLYTSPSPRDLSTSRMPSSA